LRAVFFLWGEIAFGSYAGTETPTHLYFDLLADLFAYYGYAQFFVTGEMYIGRLPRCISKLRFPPHIVPYCYYDCLHTEQEQRNLNRLS